MHIAGLVIYTDSSVHNTSLLSLSRMGTGVSKPTDSVDGVTYTEEGKYGDGKYDDGEVSE